MDVTNYIKPYYMVVGKTGISPRELVVFFLDGSSLMSARADDVRGRLKDEEVRPVLKRIQESSIETLDFFGVSRSSIELLKIEPVARSVDMSKL